MASTRERGLAVPVICRFFRAGFFFAFCSVRRAALFATFASTLVAGALGSPVPPVKFCLILVFRGTGLNEFLSELALTAVLASSFSRWSGVNRNPS